MHVIAISQTEILGRLGLALLLGAIVGVERERIERAAGMRTHALVCMGSCLIMLVSAYAFADFASVPAVRLDPSRIAAQVVSGIGFLGAGTIILRREVVRGLTTAANLWTVAGIGLAAGAGMYLVAIAGTAGALIILVVLREVEGRLFHRGHTLRLRVRSTSGQLNAIQAAFRSTGIGIRALSLREGRREGEERIRVECAPARPQDMLRLVEALRAVPELISIQGSILGQVGEDEQDGDQSTDVKI